MDIKLYFFPVMEWSTDTKTNYDDSEVYIEHGYVFVSSTGRNHVKMAAFSFKFWDLLRLIWGITQITKHMESERI